MKAKRKIIMPTQEEDAAINAGIAADPDTYELSTKEFKQLKPLRGRPVGSGKKEQVTIRLDSDILDAFKLMGAGWQTKINAALKAYIEKRPK